jgi:hypothetical protein
MDAKLTLSLNKSVIEEAKLFAKSNGTSLSRLIESYLSRISSSEKKKDEITPLVKSLSGVIELDTEANIKDDYTDYLIEKYK